MDVGVFRNGEHPAERIAADFSVNEFGNFDDVGAVFADPVVSGESAVEDALFHIAGHFLRADEHTFDFGIVNRGEIRTGVDRDLITGFGEHIGCRLFQTAFRKSEHQFVCHIVFSMVLISYRKRNISRF